MRKIKEILRLKWDCKLSNRQIGESCIAKDEKVLQIHE